ncbi:MAG TPA: hypothetical protein VNU75_06425 [Acidimicrobiales bacterium]|jgi:hypothetical protein|nr:hypothetical protein [Acidimicrobiales bacterium]
MTVSFEVTEELELSRTAPIPTRGRRDQFRTGAGALLLVVAVTMAVFTGPLFMGSGTAGASAKTTTTRSVTSRVIRAPIGYMESSGSGVTNGPVSSAAFDQWIGTGSSAAYGYVGGYDVTYNNTATNESIEVTLFSFHSHADAGAFGTVAPGGWGASSLAPVTKTIRAIRGSVVEIGTKAGSDGFYLVDAFATKGNTAMIVEYANTSKPNGIPKPLASAVASQYSRL